MRKFALAAVLEFVDKGMVSGFTKVEAVASRTLRKLRGLGTGMRRLGGAMSGLAMSAAPMSAALAFVARDGMKFEQSMANLRAVTLDTTGESTAALKSMAKTMGATTKFSASQAADAMTNLARAGFTTEEIMGALPGTLSAAAAEGIDLATAANLVASNVRAFGLEAKDAGMVAGTLALVSARTNTNMVGLQEGLKYAAADAKTLGWDLKETTLALGAMADIGVRGTHTGTALRQAVTKLAKPTKEMLAVFGGQAGLNKVLMNTDGTIRPLADVMFDLADKISKQPTAVERAGMAVKIFGVRAKNLGSAFTMTEKQLEAYRAKQAELRKEMGQTAEIMKQEQMKTLTGQLTLMRSALESVNIELFGLLSGFTGGGVNAITDSLGKLSVALRVVQGEKIKDPETMKILRSMSSTYLDVAQGIKDGFTAVKNVISSLLESLGKFGRLLGITGESGSRGIAEVATKFGLLLAVAAPVALALGGILSLFGGLLTALAGPVGIIGLLIYKFVDLKAVWDGFTAAIAPALAPLWDTFVGLKNQLGIMLKSIYGITDTKESWKKFGQVVGAVLGSILEVVRMVVEGFRQMIELYNEIRSGDMMRWIMHGDDAFKQKHASDETIAAGNAAVTVAQLAKLAQEGKTVDGKTVTRDLAEDRVRDYFKRIGLSQEQQTKAMASIASALANFPGARTSGAVEAVKDAAVSRSGWVKASAGDVLLDRAALAAAVTSGRGGLVEQTTGFSSSQGPRAVSPAVPAMPSPRAETLRLEVPLTIDGREIARAVASVELDQLQRRGRVDPGTRSNLLGGRLTR